MADKELKYPKGKHPASLANLKRGRDSHFANRENAKKAAHKSQEVQHTKRTMRELAEAVGQELQTFEIKKKDENGKVVTEKVTMSRLEMIIRNFLKECVSNPSAKNIIALAKLRGEDEQHISIETNNEAKYAEITITDEMRERAVALLMMKHQNGVN